MAPLAARPIIEIGEHPYLKQMLPAETLFVSVGTASPHPLADLVLTGGAVLHRAPLLWRLCTAPGTSLIVARIHHHPGRAWAVLRRLLGRARRACPARLVVLDFEDEDTVRPAHLPLLDAADLVFKRELPVDRWRLARRIPGLAVEERRLRAEPAARALVEKLRPLPLGLPLTEARHLIPAEPVPKASDIFFAGAVAGNAWLREQGLAELRGLADEGATLDLPEAPLPPAEFYRRCAAAWLVWSPSGYGWDCFRHYEAAAAGAVPLIPYPTIERYAGLQDGVHAVFYDPRPGGGLRDAALAALADRPRLARMAAAGRALVARHHRPEAIAARILAEALGSAHPLPAALLAAARAANAPATGPAAP